MSKSVYKYVNYVSYVIKVNTSGKKEGRETKFSRVR